MKPTNRDMHSSLMDGGEEAAGAREVFVDLGTLIVEGRMPGGPHAAARGYGEGPHCVRAQPPGLPSRVHTCDRSAACTRAANLRRHTQLLCENRVPMCVEVSLCADCPCGAARAASPEVAHQPSAQDMLLEQWTIAVVKNKSSDGGGMGARGLLQAVRSQLHFSQLSAWYSSSGGAAPAHVSYRVTVPGEAFASHFRSTPATHVFPVAALTRNTAIKVSVKTAPRMEAVPRVLCSLHHGAESRAAAVAGAAAAAVEEPARVDSLLGECLLDPSMSRRYQSPQRGCLPLSDAPERRREPSPPASHPLVDDRMQHLCNRSGKHHCRCDDEVEPVAPVAPPAREESKQCKRVKKEGERGLNLELSPREFKEVLSVLRDRNPSASHHGARVKAQSPDRSVKLLCYTPTPEAAPTPAFHAHAPAGKSDLFMDAILRAQEASTQSDDDLAMSIAKIRLDSLKSSSGTKRKRIETKTCDPDRCEASSSIDERTLSCVPRKMNKSRDKVPNNNSESVMCGRESPECLDRPVPSALDKEKFRRSLDFAASMVFHSRTGLPLTSSPAPVRRNATCFAYDSSITSVSAIRSALFDDEVAAGDEVTSSDDAESEGRSPRTPCPPVRSSWSRYTHLASSLLGTFEESALNGRLEPVSTVQGFTANLGASGSFCPRHAVLPVTVFFYTLGDNDKVSTPYLAHINLGKKGYNVPRCGTIQVTLFNPMGTVVKMFVVMYDLTDMPANSQTFLRQRTLYMPADARADAQPDDFQKWLRYLVHLRFSSSKSGRVYLHSDIRMIIFRKSDLDTATAHGVDMSYELRSFTQGPTNPKFSTRK